MKQYGSGWFEAPLAQKPRWLQGTATPPALIVNSNGTYAATFTSAAGPHCFGPINVTFPVEGQCKSWPQTGAILKDAPHPETTELLHSWILSEEQPNSTGTWSVRKDIPPPEGLASILEMSGTDTKKFAEWMSDRAAVERLRFFFETIIGSAQGLSPLNDYLREIDTVLANFESAHV